VEATLCQWTSGLSIAGAIAGIYRHIRDIPYAVLPELVHPHNYVEILKVGKGSCSPKHFLLAEMYQRLGLNVLYAVYPFNWNSGLIPYSTEVRKAATGLPQGHHLACRVEIGDRLVLVDATLDLPMVKLGLAVNESWDGVSDTRLAVVPSGEEQLFHPSERYLMRPPVVDTVSAAFYEKLNVWLDSVRNGSPKKG